MRVVIAPDSFKGTASAIEVAAAISSGWRSVRPDDELRLFPLADGGEGTLQAIEEAVPGAARVPISVRGPDDRQVQAYWLLLPDGTGVVELANTSGITLLDRLRPLTAHTIGFGQAIAAALNYRVNRLILAIGGSSSCDGGAGALSVLGTKLHDSAQTPIPPGNVGLGALTLVDMSHMNLLPAFGAVVLCDVTNPLLGPTGAAAVFGRQKGASDTQIAELESNLSRLPELIPIDPATPGTGAAGGTAFGLMAWGAKVEAGAAVVGTLLGIPSAIRDADLVVTGEGQFDDQSSAGKVPAYVVSLAMATNTPVALVAGIIEAPTSCFVTAQSLSILAGGTASAIADPLAYLHRAGAELAAAQKN